MGTKETIREKLIKKGVGKRLAFLIDTLNEEIQKNGREIVLDKDILFLRCNGSTIAKIGCIKRNPAFVYDSLLFLEEGKIANEVFRSIFFESFMDLMIEAPSICNYNNDNVEIRIPIIHFFNISFDKSGEILDITLFDNNSKVLAFASKICTNTGYDITK
ncbi:MAG: hypothetical protein ACPL0A_02285 [Candidatus Micrarchaeia archaeon]